MNFTKTVKRAVSIALTASFVLSTAVFAAPGYIIGGVRYLSSDVATSAAEMQALNTKLTTLGANSLIVDLGSGNICNYGAFTAANNGNINTASFMQYAAAHPAQVPAGTVIASPTNLTGAGNPDPDATGSTTPAAVDISTVTAVDGTITLVMNSVPTVSPVVGDFAVTKAIGGAAATTVVPSALTWTAATKTVTLTVAQVAPTAADQSVVYSVAYKTNAAKAAAAYTVPKTSALAISSVTAVNDSQVNVTFNQAVNATAGADATMYTLKDQNGTSVQIDEVALSSDAKTATLTVGTGTNPVNLISATKTYTVTVANDLTLATEPALTTALTGTCTATADSTLAQVSSVQPIGSSVLRVTFSKPVVLNGTSRLIFGIQASNGTYTMGQDLAANNLAVAYVANTAYKTYDVTLTAQLPAGNYNLKVLGNSDATNFVADAQGLKLVTSVNAFTVANPGTVNTVVSYTVVDRTHVTLEFAQPIAAPANSTCLQWSEGATSNVAGSATAPTVVSATKLTYVLNATSAGALPVANDVTLSLVGAVDSYGNTIPTKTFTNVVVPADASATVTAAQNAASLTSVKVTFSKDMQNDALAGGADVLTNYSVTVNGTAVNPTAVSYSTKVATLTFANAFAAGSYSVSVSGIKDTLGATMTAASASFTITDTQNPTISTVWYADGVTVGGAAKDEFIVQFNKAMNATALTDKTNYKYVVSGGSVLNTTGDLPSASTLTAFGGNKLVKIVMPDATILGSIATDDIYFGRLVGTTYKGVSDAAGNSLASGSWIQHSPTVRTGITWGSGLTAKIADDHTITVTEANATNGWGTVTASDFAATKNGSAVSISSVAVDELTTTTGMNNRVTFTFPAGTFKAGDVAALTLTAADTTTDMYGVQIGAGTQNVTTNMIAPQMISASLIDSQNILVTFDGALTNDLANNGNPLASLGNDLIVTQGTTTVNGADATPVAGKIKVTAAGTQNGTQFNVQLNATNALDVSSPVTIKTKSADFITSVNASSIPMKANTTGLTFNNTTAPLAATSLSVEVGNGSSIATSAFTAGTASDKIDIVFNRAIDTTTIDSAWTDNTTTDDIASCTVSTSDVLTIPGVGTFSGVYPLNHVALSGSTFTASWNAGTRTLSLTLKAADANSDKMILGYRGITYTPASTIKSASGATIDTTVTVSGLDSSVKLIDTATKTSVADAATSLPAGSTVLVYWNGPAQLVIPHPAEYTLAIPTATGGTFTVTAGGYTTAAQAFNVSAANLQTAIRGLNAGASFPNATVGLTGTTYTIDFYGVDGDVVVTADYSSLTGGSAPGDCVTTHSVTGTARTYPASFTGITSINALTTDLRSITGSVEPTIATNTDKSVWTLTIGAGGLTATVGTTTIQPVAAVLSSNTKGVGEITTNATTAVDNSVLSVTSTINHE